MVLGNKDSDQITHRVQIGIKDRDGNGSTSAYVGWFTNALMQRKLIAFDGQKWFVQATSGARYTPVGESEVPQEVKERFYKRVFKGLVA